MAEQRKYRCRKCGIDMLVGPYIAPELCSACQLAANAEGTRRACGAKDLLMQLRMRPYSNPSFWMLAAADEIERLQSIIASKLHRRRCHDCGHVGWYVDSRTPYCLCDRCCSWLCDRCRSWDTRRVKEAQ
jgi:hypothetical protein